MFTIKAMSGREALACYLRTLGEARLARANRRADIHAAARVLAFAYFVEALQDGGLIAGMLDAARPTTAPGEFPSKSGRDLISQWEDGECPCPLDVLLQMIVEGEVRVRLDAELAAL